MIFYSLGINAEKEKLFAGEGFRIAEAGVIRGFPFSRRATTFPVHFHRPNSATGLPVRFSWSPVVEALGLVRLPVPTQRLMLASLIAPRKFLLSAHLSGHDFLTDTFLRCISVYVCFVASRSNYPRLPLGDYGTEINRANVGESYHAIALPKIGRQAKYGYHQRVFGLNRSC